MRMNWYTALSMIALVALWLIAFRYCSGPSSKGSILVGREFCRTIELPEFWEKANSEMVATSSANLEYKKSGTDPNTWCLVHNDLYTENRSLKMLCISNSSVTLLPIDSEWREAPNIDIIQTYKWDKQAPDQIDRLLQTRRKGIFQRAGVKVKLAGQSWCDLVHPSADLIYAILISCDEDNVLERFITPPTWWGDARRNVHSPIYLQVINLSSGEELVRVRYALAWLEDAYIKAETGWLDNRTFVTADKRDRKVTICTLP